MAPTPEDDHRTDQELVDACNAGDPAAFDVLYRRHRDWALGVAYRAAADRHAALDLLQDAFLYILSILPRLDARRTLRPLLTAVIRNAARTRARRAPTAPLDAADTPVQPPLPPDLDERAATARRAVENLPEPQREVLLMRALDGLTLQEIALVLGVPLGTVKSRLHHALKALREDPGTRAYFEGPDEDAPPPYS